MLNPLGSTFITGLSSYRSYFKEALDKLSVTVNIFRVGQYKSAVEPLMRNSMSTNVKEESKVLLDDLWQLIRRSRGRKRTGCWRNQYLCQRGTQSTESEQW